jgi:hypothetical protein
MHRSVFINAHNRFLLPVVSLMLVTKPTSQLVATLLFGEVADVAMTHCSVAVRISVTTRSIISCIQKTVS